MNETDAQGAQPIGWAGGRPGADPMKDIAGIGMLAGLFALVPTGVLSLAGVESAETVGFVCGLLGAVGFAWQARKKHQRVCAVRIENGAVHAINKDGTVRWSEPLSAYDELWLTARRRRGAQHDYELQLCHRDDERTVRFREVIQNDPDRALASARSMAAALGGIALRDHQGRVSR